MLYTFQQPVRGGYYYIVAKAKNEEEAADKAQQIASTFEHSTGLLQTLSQLREGTLVLNPEMQTRLDEFGVAHKFTFVPHPPFHERTHKGFPPK